MVCKEMVRNPPWTVMLLPTSTRKQREPSEMTLVEDMSGGCRVSKYPENMRKEKKEVLQSELEITLSTHE
jgi:hypothetical protein